MASLDTFGAKSQLSVGDASYEIYKIDKVEGHDRLPYSLKILLENLLRTEDGANITADHIRALGAWDPAADPSVEIQFTPARVLMQDFTGVPCVVDLATMREAVRDLGGDATKVNPLAPAELVIDHSVIADVFGRPDAFERNVEFEYGRNKERYQFLRWGQTAFNEFKVVPPGTGIVHQVNIEHLARVVVPRDGQAYPDTLVGTDSHTTMVNGLGVLGWGVGGIEAEAAMLGQPVSMLIPRVVGFKLNGSLPDGATATDLVLTITQMLRKHGVVGKFVEFYGPGVAAVPLANRATIGNMSPEFGSTCAIFPIDEETVRYLRFTGRTREQVALVEAYAKEQGLWHDPAPPSRPTPSTSSWICPLWCRRSPARSGRRTGSRSPTRRRRSARCCRTTSPTTGWTRRSRRASPPRTRRLIELPRQLGRAHKPTAGHHGRRLVSFDLDHGAVVIASITSCTNTSNPQVMIGAALLAKKAVERGPELASRGSRPPSRRGPKWSWTTTRRPASCRTWRSSASTSSATAAPPASATPARCPRRSPPRCRRHDLAVVSVLSGNRNFEGRINPDVKMNYLASPPLVVAYAIAGTMDLDLTREPLGRRRRRRTRCTWATSGPRRRRCRRSSTRRSRRRCSRRTTPTSSPATSAGSRCRRRRARRSRGTPSSTYVRKPPYFEGMAATPAPGHRHRRRPGAGQARRLGDHRPHLAGRLHQGRLPGRALPDRARRGHARTSTRTGRAAATTR